MQILDSGVIYRRTLERMLIGPHDHVLNFPRLDFFFWYSVSQELIVGLSAFFLSASPAVLKERKQRVPFSSLSHTHYFLLLFTLPSKTPI